MAERVATQKRCCACKQLLSIDNFTKDKTTKDGYDARCKNCKKTKNAKYYEGHKEKISRRTTEYQKTYTRPITEAFKIAQRKWRTKNKFKIREYSHRRRALTIGVVDFNFILQRDGYICYLCNNYIEEYLEFDHVKPLSKGGEHTNENIKPTHRSCNRKKHVKEVI